MVVVVCVVVEVEEVVVFFLGSVLTGMGVETVVDVVVVVDVLVVVSEMDEIVIEAEVVMLLPFPVVVRCS